MKKFIYQKNVNNYLQGDKDVFFALMSPKIKSEDKLFSELYTKLKFPDYFGFNWNAVSDCLRDLQWIKEYNVVILHADLPNLQDNELYLYLDILRYCMNDWEKYEGPYQKHNLDVIFPIVTKENIDYILKSRKSY